MALLLDAPPKTEGRRGGRLSERPAPAALRPHLIGELLVIVVLVRVYDRIKSLADQHASTALANARQLLHVESLLRLDPERAINQLVTRSHLVSIGMSWWYQFLHQGLTLILLGWCWWFRPGRYRSARNALVAINVVGLAVFVVFPVMPPRLLPGGGFIDTVAAAGFGSTHGGPVSADQFAAMPSLHLAWACWVALLMVAEVRHRWARLAWALYPAGTALVVLATGNHYVLDLLAGVLVALLAGWGSGLVGHGPRRRWPRREASAPLAP